MTPAATPARTGGRLMADSPSSDERAIAYWLMERKVRSAEVLHLTAKQRRSVATYLLATPWKEGDADRISRVRWFAVKELVAKLEPPLDPFTGLPLDAY